MKRLFKKTFEETVVEIFRVNTREDVDEVMDYLRDEYRDVRIMFDPEKIPLNKPLTINIAIDPMCYDEMLGDYPSDTAYILDPQDLDYFTGELNDEFFNNMEYIGEKEQVTLLFFYARLIQLYYYIIKRKKGNEL